MGYWEAAEPGALSPHCVLYCIVFLMYCAYLVLIVFMLSYTATSRRAPIPTPPSDAPTSG